MKQFLIPCILVVLAFKTNKVTNTYTPYQVKLWATKAFESFSPTWYPDGKGKHSIGFGFNDWGKTSRRKEIAWAGNPISWADAVKITLLEYDKMNVKEKDPWVKAAFEMHIYNKGNCRSIKELRGCCGASVGCGSPSVNIRKSHSPRRKLEFAMATHDFYTVYAMAADLKKIAARLEAEHK